MIGVPTGFWGKLHRGTDATDVEAWHPLVDHCADVAACAEALLKLPTWRRRLARVCGRNDLDEVTRARLAVLAALHDLGKFNLGFQAIGRPDLGTTAGHVREGLAAIWEDVGSSLQPLNAWGEGTTGLLVSAVCHHGRPYSLEHPISFEPVLWAPRGGLNPKEGIARLVAACRVWFPLAFDSGGTTLPYTAEFEHAFAGLVMLADWVGSDNDIFCFSNESGTDRMAFARDAAKRFVSESWLDIYEERRADRASRDPFVRIADEGDRPRSGQRALLELTGDDDWSIAVLESETGSGKTEAALAHFVKLFSKGAVDGLYFALPTRSAATQMHRRVHEAARRAFETPPPVLLAVPGYLLVDDIKGEREVQGKRLPDFEVLWPDKDDRFRHRAWAAEGPKRYLAGCIVVGTIDQVLLSSLRVRHAHLRATALLRQLLVVDEVHASDSYMTRILEDVLARHKMAGGHALLLSATLGGEARARLLHPGARATLPDLGEAERTPYPLVSHRGTSSRTIVVSHDDEQRKVNIALAPSLEDVAAVAATALRAAIAGAKVLVIKNTVADCIETQRVLEQLAATASAVDVLFSCHERVAPHHARFARADRGELDKALEQHIGKGRPSGGCVIVATQTVQQSLDIDADFLLTDLCPMDVLLQRIGRLHRHHSHARPAGFETPCTQVIAPLHRDLGVLLSEHGKARHHHGLGTVYPDLRVLEATWRSIEEFQTWRIPEMNRALVERSVHSAALAAISADAGERWAAHAQQMQGARRGETRQADLNLVDWTTPYSETTFADDEHISTRLGEGDRRVGFKEPFVSPFGHAVNELVVRAAWAIGVPSDVDEADAVTSADGITKFRYGDRRFVYDRHGLRLDKKEQSDFADDDGP